MMGEVCGRVTGGAKLVDGAMGSALTDNRCGRSGAGSASDLAMDCGGSAALSEDSSLIVGRGTRGDEKFTGTTDRH
jgi:hypothetical protein